MKDDDREVYDLVFDAAFVLVKSDKLLNQTIGKLLFTILNEWEKGHLRKNIAIVSKAYDVAMELEFGLVEELNATLQEVMEDVKSDPSPEGSPEPTA